MLLPVLWLSSCSGGDKPVREAVAAPDSRGLLYGGRTVWTWPLKKGRVSSWFGKRGRRRHEGIDISAPRGSPVLAAAPGRVVAVGWRRGYGRVVEVRHRRTGMLTRYAHLKNFSVSRGEDVERGAPLGGVGRSGRSTGYHLHFEMRTPAGVAVNPLDHLSPALRGYVRR